MILNNWNMTFEGEAYCFHEKNVACNYREKKCIISRPQNCQKNFLKIRSWSCKKYITVQNVLMLLMKSQLSRVIMIFYWTKVTYFEIKIFKFVQKSYKKHILQHELRWSSHVGFLHFAQQMLVLRSLSVGQKKHRFLLFILFKPTSPSGWFTSLVQSTSRIFCNSNLWSKPDRCSIFSEESAKIISYFFVCREFFWCISAHNKSFKTKVEKKFTYTFDTRSP